MSRQKSEHVAARMSSKTFEDMELERQKENRSRSSYIECAVQEYIQNRSKISVNPPIIGEHLPYVVKSATNAESGTHTQELDDLRKQVEILSRDVKELRGMIISILQSRQDE